MGKWKTLKCGNQSTAVRRKAAYQCLGSHFRISVSVLPFPYFGFRFSVFHLPVNNAMCGFHGRMICYFCSIWCETFTKLRWSCQTHFLDLILSKLCYYHVLYTILLRCLIQEALHWPWKSECCENDETQAQDGSIPVTQIRGRLHNTVTVQWHHSSSA